jgi:HK97 family phage portal protein
VENRDDNLLTLTDPAIAALLGFSLTSSTGISISEFNALGLSALWRAVNLIASSIAALPMKTYRMTDNGRVACGSQFDNPAGPFSTVTGFEWVETLVAHLVLHGNGYLFRIKNAAGQTIGYTNFHPLAVFVELVPVYGTNDDNNTGPSGMRKQFKVTLDTGQIVVMTEDQILHIPGLSLNGIQGISMIQYARNSLGISLAGEAAAGSVFKNGAMMSGLVTPDGSDELSNEDATAIQDALNGNALGYNNAGTAVLINRVLKFTPWTVSPADAEFLASRAFQVEEISRWTGVPTFLLSSHDKQTSWGSGLAEQGAALNKFTLNPYVERMQARFSAELSQPRFVEFDMAGLEKPDPEGEMALILSGLNGGFYTINEARALKNLPSVPDGDDLRVPAGIMLMSKLTAPAPEPVPAAEEAPNDESL